MSLMKYSPNISHCSILTYTNTGLEWESGWGTRRALSCFSGRDLSPSFLWCQTNRSLAFSSRPPDHSELHSLEWSIIPQQAVMLSSQQRVRSQVQFRLCWALSLLARCIDQSLWWQSYLSEESLTWGRSLKCLFFSFFLNEMWHQHGGHRQANVIAMFEARTVPQWATEKQKYRRDAGTLWESGEEEEEEVCRPWSFWVLVLSLLSVLAVVMISSDMIQTHTSVQVKEEKREARGPLTQG